MNFARALRVLNAFDCVITAFCFLTYGPSAEINPLMRWLLERSLFAFVFVKLVGVAIFSFFAPRWALILGCVLYTMACAAGAALLVSGS